LQPQPLIAGDGSGIQLLHLLLLLLQPPELLRYGRMSTNVDIYRWGKGVTLYNTCCIRVIALSESAGASAAM
jgi:hypothetical protein